MLDVPVKDSLDDFVYEKTNGVVQSGPFKGMKLPREQSWLDGCISPMLLGVHEEELHGLIEEEITRLSTMSNPVIVNVGCAEGYYAVGLKMRLPKATVWAIDVDEEALRICRETAEINGVEVVTSNNVKSAFEAPDFVMMDCEGAEVEYLDYERWPMLLKARIIVEIHNRRNPPADTGEIIFNRWNVVDQIIICVEGARDPNKFDFLCYFPSAVRWMAVCENRPCRMAWYAMQQKRSEI